MSLKLIKGAPGRTGTSLIFLLAMAFIVISAYMVWQVNSLQDEVTLNVRLITKLRNIESKVVALGRPLSAGSNVTKPWEDDKDWPQLMADCVQDLGDLDRGSAEFERIHKNVEMVDKWLYRAERTFGLLRKTDPDSREGKNYVIQALGQIHQAIDQLREATFTTRTSLGSISDQLGTHWWMLNAIVVFSCILAIGVALLFIYHRKAAVARDEAVGELAANERRMRNMFDQLPIGVYRMSPAGKLLFANPSFIQMSGFDSFEELSKTDVHSELYEGQSPLRVLEKSKEAGGVLLGFDARWKQGESDPIDVRENVTVIRDRYGNAKFIEGTAENVTAIKKIENELRLAQKKAIEADRIKTRFLASLSHEVKTPLTGIIGVTELLGSTKLVEEQENYVGLISSTSHTLLRLLADILDFTKLNAQQLELSMRPYSLREAVFNCISNVAQVASEKHLEMVAFITKDVPDGLLGDEERVSQILLNLLSNSIKNTASGEIVVRIETVIKEDDSAVFHVSVRDTGVGIPVESQGAIFDEFGHLGDGYTGTLPEGVGLGLAIGRRLAEHMGGKMWIENIRPKGSEFNFTFRSHLQDKVCMSEPVPLPAELEGRSVLVAEDNDNSWAAIAEMLGDWGFIPVQAKASRIAMDCLAGAVKRDDPFLAVLVDIELEGIDDYELVRMIKKDKQHSSTRVVAMTYGRPGEAALSMDAGATAYVSKPVSGAKLRNAVLDALDVEGEREIMPTDSLAASLPATPARVLIVEDNFVNRKVAMGLLEKRGYEVHSVPNGRDAVAALKLRDFDAVLMDVQMPVMDGLEATRKIRNNENVSGRHTPIIALTAHGTKGERDECLDAGMDDFIVKPVESLMLFSVLERYIGPVVAELSS